MRQQGLTLIEVIIYSALLSLIISSSLVLMHSLISSAEKTMNQLDALAETQFIFAHLDWVLNQSQIIMEPELNQTGDRLVVKDINNIETQIDIHDKKIRVINKDGESSLSPKVIDSLLLERTNYYDQQIVTVWIKVQDQTYSNIYFLK
jgi:competence protein ComGF